VPGENLAGTRRRAALVARTPPRVDTDPPGRPAVYLAHGPGSSRRPDSPASSASAVDPAAGHGSADLSKFASEPTPNRCSSGQIDHPGSAETGPSTVLDVRSAETAQRRGTPTAMCTTADRQNPRHRLDPKPHRTRPTLALGESLIDNMLSLRTRGGRLRWCRLIWRRTPVLADYRALWQAL